MTFGARPVEVAPLGEHPLRRSKERRIGLHREPALAARVSLERRLEHAPPAGRHLLDDAPGEVDLGRVGLLRREGANPVPPERRLLLPDVGDDRRIGRRPDRAERDRVLQLVDRARIVPDVGRGRGDRPTERAVREGTDPRGPLTAPRASCVIGGRLLVVSAGRRGGGVDSAIFATSALTSPAVMLTFAAALVNRLPDPRTTLASTCAGET